MHPDLKDFNSATRITALPKFQGISREEIERYGHLLDFSVRLKRCNPAWVDLPSELSFAPSPLPDLFNKLLSTVITASKRAPIPVSAAFKFPQRPHRSAFRRRFVYAERRDFALDASLAKD